MLYFLSPEVSFFEQAASFFEQLASFFEQLLSFLEQLACLASFLLQEPAPQLFSGLSCAKTALEAMRVEAKIAMDLMFMVSFLGLMTKVCALNRHNLPVVVPN